MQFRYSPIRPLSRATAPLPAYPPFGPVCMHSSCRPAISRRHHTGELADRVSTKPGAYKQKSFSIRARSLPPQQKTEEGTLTCSMGEAWRPSCRPLGRSYLRHIVHFLAPAWSLLVVVDISTIRLRHPAFQKPLIKEAGLAARRLTNSSGSSTVPR